MRCWAAGTYRFPAWRFLFPKRYRAVWGLLAFELVSWTIGTDPVILPPWLSWVAIKERNPDLSPRHNPYSDDVIETP